MQVPGAGASMRLSFFCMNLVLTFLLTRMNMNLVDYISGMLEMAAFIWGISDSKRVAFWPSPTPSL